MIDEDTVFNEIKNKKFLLLEQMIQNNFFLYDYKSYTINFIKKIIGSDSETSYEKLIIVFDNYNKTDNFYNIVKSIIDNEQLEKLNEIYENVKEVKDKVEHLTKMQTFFKEYFTKTKADEIKEINSKIEGLKKGNLWKKNDKEYQDFFYKMFFNYKDINLDFNIIQSLYFKKIYEINKQNNENEDENDLFTQSKNEFVKLIKLFDSNLKIEEKMKDISIQKYIKFIDENKRDYFSEFISLHNVFNKPKREDYINNLINEIKIFKKYFKIKIVLLGLLNL